MIFECAHFNWRNQVEGETAEQYIITLTETCNYGKLKGEMIRDQLVVGIQDSTLLEHLKLDTNLRLQKAAIRQKGGCL